MARVRPGDAAGCRGDVDERRPGLGRAASPSTGSRDAASPGGVSGRSRACNAGSGLRRPRGRRHAAGTGWPIGNTSTQRDPRACVRTSRIRIRDRVPRPRHRAAQGSRRERRRRILPAPTRDRADATVHGHSLYLGRALAQLPPGHPTCRPRGGPRRSRHQCRVPTGVTAVPPTQSARPSQASSISPDPPHPFPHAARPPRRRAHVPAPLRATRTTFEARLGRVATAVPAPLPATCGAPTRERGATPTAAVAPFPAARSAPVPDVQDPALQRPTPCPTTAQRPMRPHARPCHRAHAPFAAHHTRARRTAAARSIGSPHAQGAAEREIHTMPAARTRPAAGRSNPPQRGPGAALEHGATHGRMHSAGEIHRFSARTGRSPNRELHSHAGAPQHVPRPLDPAPPRTSTRPRAARHMARRTAATRSIGSPHAQDAAERKLPTMPARRNTSRRPLDPTLPRASTRPLRAPGRTRATPKRPIRDVRAAGMALPGLAETPATDRGRSPRSRIATQRPDIRQGPKPRLAILAATPAAGRAPHASRPRVDPTAPERDAGPRAVRPRTAARRRDLPRLSNAQLEG